MIRAEPIALEAPRRTVSWPQIASIILVVLCSGGSCLSIELFGTGGISDKCFQFAKDGRVGRLPGRFRLVLGPKQLCFSEGLDGDAVGFGCRRTRRRRTRPTAAKPPSLDRTSTWQKYVVIHPFQALAFVVVKAWSAAGTPGFALRDTRKKRAAKQQLLPLLQQFVHLRPRRRKVPKPARLDLTMG